MESYSEKHALIDQDYSSKQISKKTLDKMCTSATAFTTSKFV